MIYITQGHEHSISLEVLLKSLLHFNSKQLSQLELICSKNSLLENIKILFPKTFQVHEKDLIFFNRKISLNFVSEKPESTACLAQALKKITTSDILYTLPTSKDQLLIDHKSVLGHTEFFRYYYCKNVPMIFQSPGSNIVLLTDHIQLSEVTRTITTELILEKMKIALSYFKDLKSIVFAGINPHAGESGLMGNDQEIYQSAIMELKKLYPDRSFSGPFSGDTVSHKENINCLVVYAFHDQALASFKQKNGSLGANITAGLPFLRISPDHGTAFDLYGKNKANYLGAKYCLELAFKQHEKNNH